MKSFDFNKFSRSAWMGSRHNTGWRKYPGIVTTDDSAKDLLAEHKFNAPPSGDEQCLCGWSGDSWGDHVGEVLAASQKAAEPREAAPKVKPAKAAGAVSAAKDAE